MRLVSNSKINPINFLSYQREIIFATEREARYCLSQCVLHSLSYKFPLTVNEPMNSYSAIIEDIEGGTR
jgi:hypothetical protein